MRTPSRRSSPRANAAQVHTSHRGPNPDIVPNPPVSFATLIEHIKIPLSDTEAVDLRRALDSTGELNLGTLPPSTVWALDALWRALSEPDAPKVRSIMFPEGMAGVPHGVRALPDLDHITLLHFQGAEVMGGQARPLTITISIDAFKSPKDVKFVISENDTIAWQGKPRPMRWSVSRYDQHGKIIGEQSCYEPKSMSDSPNVKSIAQAQNRIFNACKTGKGTVQLRKDLPKSRPPGEAAKTWHLTLWRTVGKNQAISLLHRLQREQGHQALRRFISFLLSIDLLTPAEKEWLLMQALVPAAHPIETDLLLPDQVADIIAEMPEDSRKGVNPDLLRLVTPCRLPQQDYPACKLHDWVLHNRPAFTDLVERAVSNSTSMKSLACLLEPDGAGRSPLHVAAAGGWSEEANGLITRILAAPHLDEEARTQLVHALFAMQTHDGDTLLWHAAAQGEQVCAKLDSLFRVVLRESELSWNSKFVLISHLLHIERPRPAVARIVRSVAFDALETWRDDVASFLTLGILVDVLTFCPDSTVPTMVQQTVEEASGDFLLVRCLAQLTKIPQARFDDARVLRYLLARGHLGRTALHDCSLRNDEKQVRKFTTALLDLSPTEGDLAEVWTALDGHGRTPFWAAIEAGALCAAAAWLDLAASLAQSTDRLPSAFVKSVTHGIRGASEENLERLLSVRGNDGRDLLHTLVQAGLGGALCFVVAQVLASRLSEFTKADLLAKALRGNATSVSPLVEAMEQPHVLNGMLALLAQTKELTEQDKEHVLANLLTMGDGEFDRRRAVTPVLLAVSKAPCSGTWKTALQVLSDLRSRDPKAPGSTQLHVAAVKSADTARPRMSACVQLLRKDIVSAESLSAYLGARNEAGRTAFDEAARHRKVDVTAAFLCVAAGDDPQSGRAVFHGFVADSIASADEAMLSALLEPDDTGRTVFHAAASAGDGEGLCLLLTSLLASTLDAEIVVPLLAAALARTRSGKTLLSEFASDPSAARVLSPMVATLATSRWSAGQKEALWKALVETERRPPRKAAAAMLELLSASAGDLLPLPIRRSLEASQAPSQAVHRQVIVGAQPLVAPNNAQYLFQRQVDIDHVLDGTVNAAGQAVGGHALMPASSKHLRARPGAVVNEHANETFTVLVDIKPAGGPDWIPKNEPSTCFPLAWTRSKMRHEIASALRRGDAFVAGEGPWDSQSDSGLWIRFFRSNGKVTCFPLSQ